MVRLLQDTLRSDRLAEELSAKIALTSDGKPFFVFELLREFRSSRTASSAYLKRGDAEEFQRTFAAAPPRGFKKILDRMDMLGDEYAAADVEGKRRIAKETGGQYKAVGAQ